jgi:hypothetical protein
MPELSIPDAMTFLCELLKKHGADLKVRVELISSSRVDTLTSPPPVAQSLYSQIENAVPVKAGTPPRGVRDLRGLEERWAQLRLKSPSEGQASQPRGAATSPMFKNPFAWKGTKVDRDARGIIRTQSVATQQRVRQEEAIARSFSREQRAKSPISPASLDTVGRGHKLDSPVPILRYDPQGSDAQATLPAESSPLMQSGPYERALAHPLLQRTAGKGLSTKGFAWVVR